MTFRLACPIYRRYPYKFSPQREHTLIILDIRLPHQALSKQSDISSYIYVLFTFAKSHKFQNYKRLYVYYFSS